MKLYAVMAVQPEKPGVESIIMETVSANPDFVKVDVLRFQSQDATRLFHMGVFDKTEKQTPPVDSAWTIEAEVNP